MLQDDIISLQGAAVVGLDKLVERHAAHTRDAEAQWEALAQGGRALAERQGRYEAFQARGRPAGPACWRSSDRNFMSCNESRLCPVSACNTIDAPQPLPAGPHY
jgi:hypothetical protein